MKKDYNRAICNECPIKEECEEYRNKNWCIHCPSSLRCLVRNDNINSACAIPKSYWKNLLSTCALVNSLIEKATQTQQSETIFIKEGLGSWTCPRCSLKSFVLYRPYYRIIPGTYYKGLCMACGICGSGY